MSVPLLNRNVLVLRPIGYKASPSLGLASITTESLGVPANGDYDLYVASGARRDGDVGDILSDHLPIVSIDVRVGGQKHNLLDPAVGKALVAAARDPRCTAVLESLDCSTWTAAHFLPDKRGRPGMPLRNAFHVLGLNAPDGSLSRRVCEANIMTELGAAIATAATSHGARVIAETPACRGTGQNGRVTVAQPGDGLVGAELHVYMFDHPAWKAFATECRAEVTTFDQCMFLDSDPFTSNDRGREKATALIANATCLEDVRRVFGDRRCNHPKGTHVAIRGADENGTYRTVGTEAYSRAMCRGLALCLSPAYAASSGAHFGGIELGLMGGVIQGKRLPRSAVTSEFIHRSFSHSEHRVNRHLCDALCDVPAWWRDVITSEPCDACLRGEAPRLGPSGSLPRDEGLVFVDIYHTQTPTLWRREKTVVGVTHAASRIKRSWRVSAKSQAPEVFHLALAFFNSVGKPVTWIHTNGVNELKGSGIVPLSRSNQIRITTTLVGGKNQNPQEPSWRALNMTTRKELA